MKKLKRFNILSYLFLKYNYLFLIKNINIKVITNSACSRIKRVTSRMICAGGGGGKGVCSGDSGGPLVSSGTGDGVTPGSNYELIGVASFVLGACADKNNYPSGYAR